MVYDNRKTAGYILKGSRNSCCTVAVNSNAAQHFLLQIIENIENSRRYRFRMEPVPSAVCIKWIKTYAK